MSPQKIITSLFLCSQMSVQDGRWCHRNAPARGIVACESLLRLAQSVFRLGPAKAEAGPEQGS